MMTETSASEGTSRVGDLEDTKPESSDDDAFV